LFYKPAGLMQNRTYVYTDLKKFYENLDPVYMQDKKGQRGWWQQQGL